MKIEVRCPNCDRGYLIDEAAVDGELCCIDCSTAIELNEARPAEASTETVAAPMRAAQILASVGVGDNQASTQPTYESGAKSPPRQAAATGVASEIVCPRCKLHFSPKRHAAKSGDSDERPTVLVVEDLQYFREIAADALSAHCEVVTATSVFEARRHMATGRVDLLVLDLTLDGGEHGKSLLGSLGDKPCPVLIFTAKDESEMIGDPWAELQAMGADDMVIKNMHAGESLVRKVGELLGRSWDE